MLINRQLQKIEYAKSKSDFVSKLDGTFNIPDTKGAANVEQTALQQSIFNAPPPSSTGAPGTGLPAKPAAATDQPMKDASVEPDARGQKRTRDEEDESDSDVAMEEDSDEE